MAEPKKLGRPAKPKEVISYASAQGLDREKV